MKYYLVNYIILDNRTITENENIGISLHTFPNIALLKQAIADTRNDLPGTEIVIKSHQQISREAFNSLNAVMA